MMRLPRKTTKAVKVRHVVHTLKVLRIDHIRDSLVGDASRRGVSGGQKKRVNIGMELVAMPAVCFMDEPTSGLDGAATSQLAQCLGQLRKSGLTIICVIHQPRYSVYKEFTHLLLLGAGGRQVYCGDTDKIQPYLTSLGFKLPPMENVADWMIDAVCGLAPRYNTDGEVDTEFKAPADLFTAWEKNYKHTCVVKGANGLLESNPDFYWANEELTRENEQLKARASPAQHNVSPARPAWSSRPRPFPPFAPLPSPQPESAPNARKEKAHARCSNRCSNNERALSHCSEDAHDAPPHPDKQGVDSPNSRKGSDGTATPNTRKGAANARMSKFAEGIGEGMQSVKAHMPHLHKPQSVLTPRDTHKRGKQTYYLCGRSFRQHDMLLFVACCVALFMEGMIFTMLFTSINEYSYIMLLPRLIGGEGGAPLFFLIIANYVHPLFTAEKLHYYREFKVGFSCIAYWAGKNLYNMVLLPFMGASFALSVYLFAPPLQGFHEFFLSNLLAAWFWSGAAMFASTFCPTQMMSTLLLIFWPLFEPTLEGHPSLGTTPRTSPPSALTCGRWYRQALLAAEVNALPPHIRNFREIEVQLYDRAMSDDMVWMRDQGWWCLFGWGIFYRVVTMVVLALGKYSEGGNYISQVYFVIKRMAYAAGITSGVRETVDSDAFEAQEVAELQRLEFIERQRASTITDLRTVETTPRNLQLMDMSGGLNDGQPNGGSFHDVSNSGRGVSFGLDTNRLSKKSNSKFSMVPDV